MLLPKHNVNQLDYEVSFDWILNSKLNRTEKVRENSDSVGSYLSLTFWRFVTDLLIQKSIFIHRSGCISPEVSTSGKSQGKQRKGIGVSTFL